jgi:MFS family permease
MGFLSRFLKTGDIPYGVRMLTYAASVRWVGWGFAEALIPIFLFSFTDTYAAAGLLRSAFDIGFILMLPIAGMAADRFLSTSLILVGLVIYLFIGSAYFFAGVTGLVILVVIARFLNGISLSLDALGRETYVRRHTPREKIATVFGYFDTITSFWWIMAALAGAVLVKFFSIHALLFLVTPTSLIAFFMIWRFRKNSGEEGPKAGERGLKSAYSEILRELGVWNWKLRSVAMFNFFIAFASAVVGFFLPIEAYVQGADLSRTILLGVVFVIPTLLGWTLGKYFDRKGSAVFLYGFIVLGILFGLLGFFDSYAVKILVAFGVGVVLELLSVGSNELITAYANPEHFGRVGGVMRSIADFGGMIGPLLVGILIDWQGIHFSFLALAILIFILAAIFYVLLKDGFSTFPSVAEKYYHKLHQRI